ncbi:hypothetical protein BASA81_005458 [Batrachochytrium salamandrivorans]|nr:hypothetical protein BASA81_005458 [Batrachochytrium salamandrivorans]
MLTAKPSLPGVVTVFSTTTCPYCKASIALLESKSVSIRVWELDLYPGAALQEMRAWTEGATSVPQIFFNSSFLRGGNSALQALEGAGKLDDFLVETLSEAVESELDLPRITLAKLPVFEEGEGVEKDEKEIWGFAGLPRGSVEEMELREFYQRLRLALAGKAPFGVETLQTNSQLLLTGEGSADDAVWEKLVEYGVIVSIVASWSVAWMWWRPMPPPQFGFSQDQTPMVLNLVFDNQCRARPKIAKRTALELAAKIKHEIALLYLTFLSKDGRRVRYSDMRDSIEFIRYVDLTHELQTASLRELSMETHRRAFFINLYNALVLHGICELGYPTTPAARSKFFTHTAYRVGPDLIFSLNDIEHGVLRGNRSGPAGFLPFFRGFHYSSLPPFSADEDERFRYSCLQLDCRVHFALNCGALSCPPIKLYTSEDLDSELDLCARAFCEDDSAGVRVDLAAKEVTLSMLFKWYAADFGDTEVARLITIAEFLPQHKRDDLRELLNQGHFTVKYFAYDWTSNGLLREPLTEATIEL